MRPRGNLPLMRRVVARADFPQPRGLKIALKKVRLPATYDRAARKFPNSLPALELHCRCACIASSVPLSHISLTLPQH